MKNLLAILFLFIGLNSFAQSPDTLVVKDEQKELVGPKTYALNFPRRSLVDSLNQRVLQQQKAIDSLRRAITSIQTGLVSLLTVDTVKTSTYQLTSLDNGKHLIFTRSCQINVTGFPRGATVVLRGTASGTKLVGNCITKVKNTFVFIQPGGCAVVRGEGFNASATGDLSTN